ncbi:MAG: hypothetical protein QG597_3214, partial [Actinomycetota bacterium]|nr:hypothetical protein [Actinomycetota bacterium]
ATYVPTENQTLYAQWVPTTYVISYDGNGATAGVVPPNGGYTSGGTVYTVLGNTGSPALTRPGYTFAGWNSAANGSGTPYGPGTANLTYGSTADLTLYAQWTQNPSFAITYNVGSDPGVTGNAPAAGSYITGGAAYTVVGNTGTPAVLSRPGYTFANWNTDPAGGGTAYGPGTANTTYSTAAALSLYPQWTPWALATLQVNVTGAQAGPLKNSPVEVYRVVGGVPEVVPYATGKSNASGAVTTKTGGSPLTLPPDTYRVKGKNPCGLALFVGWSADTVVASSNVSITVPVPPTIPCVVQSAAYTAGSKTLSWAAPVNDGGRSVTSYEVVYIAQSALPAGKWRMFSYNIAPGTTSLNLGSASCPVGTTCPAPFVPLTPGTNYQVRVYARNAQGRGIVKTVTGVVV